VIDPHGGELVDLLARAGERDELTSRAAELASVTLSARQAADVELLAVGGFSPLRGFQGSQDWRSVVEDLHLANGLPWSIPVTLASDVETTVGDELALRCADGRILGVLSVEEIFQRDSEREAAKVYLTTDDEHPGVAAIRQEGTRSIAGKIEADALPDHDEAFMRRYQTTEESKKAFADRGWKRIVAFQTRNPIHRAHEYLTKAALEICDGLYIHPLIGETKKGDIPADVRMRCCEVLMENYYHPEHVMLGVNPGKMHYAGPREAVLHAIIRRNYGCTHFIVGRDHAGVGDYYGTYDAQHIFDEIDLDRLGITPLFFEHTFWCNECEGMGSAKTCPHPQESHLFLSGTKVREMLENGEKPPHEFSRDEVAEILIDAYRKEND
jgi:sulfate adenylyltransferase